MAWGIAAHTTYALWKAPVASGIWQQRCFAAPRSTEWWGHGKLSDGHLWLIIGVSGMRSNGIPLSKPADKSMRCLGNRLKKMVPKWRISHIYYSSLRRFWYGYGSRLTSRLTIPKTSWWTSPTKTSWSWGVHWATTHCHRVRCPDKIRWKPGFVVGRCRHDRTLKRGAVRCFDAGYL